MALLASGMGQSLLLTLKQMFSCKSPLGLFPPPHLRYERRCVSALLISALRSQATPEGLESIDQ